MKIPDARSGVDGSNIQEIIDAGVSAAHALDKGQQQFQTPAWLARGCASLLPFGSHDHVIDFQCAEGNLLEAAQTNRRYGIELDNRFAEKSAHNASAGYGEIQRITGSCVHVMATMDDLYKDIRFGCIVTNPPFGIRWTVEDKTAPKGVDRVTTIDSTQWTWNTIKARLAAYGCGYMISNADTIERMKIHEDPWVYLYQRLPGTMGGIWDNCNVEIGIVHFYNRASNTRLVHIWDHVPAEREFIDLNAKVEATCHLGYSRPWQFGPIYAAWGQLTQIIKEETLDRPKYNIYLGKDGVLRTYLSTRAQIKIKREEIERLTRINKCHPLTLTTEKETRKLLHTYLTSGIYTIEPAAKKAITDALLEVASIACPIRPVTDFELVAYADEEETLKCRGLDPSRRMKLTPGKLYEVRTGTYTFTDKFERKKIHFDEETGKTEIEEHECELSGEDRYIEITDDNHTLHRFMERPGKEDGTFQHHEELLWQLFQKPYVPSIAEVQAAEYERHKSAMRFNEQLAGFTYFPGQTDYYARMACKDYGLIAADVGTGKSLGALTMIALKSPKRTLLIAPQGTMRSVGEEDEVDYQASQWVKEIQRFAPTEPVFQLFSPDDWQNILHANGGVLPNGIYITYPQAYFSNGGFEHLPPSWENVEEKKFCERYSLEFNTERPLDDCFHRNVGAANEKGIRCIAEPSLATLMTAFHGDCWEMVIIDEAHLCFPYSTKVRTLERGVLPIGEIVEQKLDVHVLSCSPRADVTEWRRITGHFRNSADRPLVRVVHERGAFVCTDDHKIRTGDRWTPAKSLVRGQELRMVPQTIRGATAWQEDPEVLLSALRQQFDQQQSGAEGCDFSVLQETSALRVPDVRRVPRAIHIPMAFEKAGGDATILHPPMWCIGEERRSEMERSCPKDVRPLLGLPERSSKLGVCAPNEAAQSDERHCCGGENAAHSFGPDIPRTWGQWPADAPAVATGRSVELANGGSDSYCRGERSFSVAPALLQSGCWERRTEAGDRSRWPEPQAEEVEISGPTKGEHPEISRVVRVEILQPRGGIADSQGRGRDHVYCLEVEGNHNFFADDVLVSNCCNLESQITKKLLRLQPKFRFAMTATPIPNIITNIFSLMGWLCVKDWYKGDLRNAAWPYAVDEVGRFNTTFLSTEVDLTAQQKAKNAGKKSWRKCGTRFSPVISSPARLLKLLKPTLAYISKEDCNPNLHGCEVIDVRVGTGKEQTKLYQYWLQRVHYLPEFKNPLTIAQVQSQRLRGICAAPATLDYTRGMCKSNFNPKTVTILELIRDCLKRGEQVVVVSARVGQSGALASRLTDAGIAIARIDSTVPADLHTAEANRFKRGDARVMLMGIKCAQGHSFELCPNLIIGSLEWSYGTLHQAKGRVWRLNSPKKVKIWCVLHKNTIEELLFDRVALKQDAATLCLHGKRVPRDFKTLDPSEILAEHVVNYDAGNGEVLSESECESQWVSLRKQLVMANVPAGEGGNESLALVA
jgi:SNF2 family DNA or RNA helicase